MLLGPPGPKWEGGAIVVDISPVSDVGIYHEQTVSGDNEVIVTVQNRYICGELVTFG